MEIGTIRKTLPTVCRNTRMKKTFSEKTRITPKIVGTVPNSNRNIVGTEAKTSHLIHNRPGINTSKTADWIQRGKD